MVYSPLRYPGGKSKISDLVKLIIQKANVDGTYIEPFAGGAGVALHLLLNNIVNDIVINDYDKAIYSFWRAIKEDGEKFIDLINSTPITIDEWKKQKDIYLSSKSYSLELGFAAFFLNRTNRSGILTAGPIGGYEQNGSYKIDARFNKVTLTKKIREIIKRKNNIHIYNKDIRSFITSVIPKYENNSFVYLDPPYYNKGQQLYKNFLTHNDHAQIANLIFENIRCPWIVSYDNVEDIARLYKNYCTRKFEVNYSAANTGKSSELLVFSNSVLCPNEQELQVNKINTKLY